MKKTFLSFVLILCFSNFVSAQFILSGEFRPRFEFRAGYRNILSTSQDDAVIITQRSRLNMYYSLPSISFGLSLQDVRVWGDETLISSSGVFGDNASIDLNEAWMNIKLYESGNLVIGRQFWKLEDERLISVRSWNQSQIKYDGLLFLHRGKVVDTDIGLSLNNRLENISGNDYPSDRMKTLNYASIGVHLTPWARVSAMVIGSGFTRTDTTSDLNFLATYSTYFVVKTNNLDAAFSGFYQHGRSRVGKQTSAYMFSLTGSYKINKVSLGAGIDYLSGNDGGNTDEAYMNKEHSFDILHGARHRYYGSLDYFSAMQKATSSAGLADIFLRFSWGCFESAKLNTDLHYFWLQNNAIDPSYAGPDLRYYNKALGPEVDINISWDILSFLNFKGGYSIFFPTGTMAGLQGVSSTAYKNPQWVWVMLTAKPTFFKSDQPK